MDWLSQRIGYGRWSLRANEDFSLERAKGIETTFHFSIARRSENQHSNYY